MRTLLLADDNITVQRVIALTFAGDKTIQVVTVADGQQAMEKMAALRPDIVLAGTTLPQISGYDLATFMRGKAELQRVPVLLLAGAFETVDEARLAFVRRERRPREAGRANGCDQSSEGAAGIEIRRDAGAGGSFDHACRRSRGEEDSRWRRRRGAPSRRRASRRRSGKSSASNPPSRPKPRRSKSRRAVGAIISIRSTPRSIRSINSCLAACRPRRPRAIPPARSASRAAPPIRDRRAAGLRAAQPRRQSGVRGR